MIEFLKKMRLATVAVQTHGHYF